MSSKSKIETERGEREDGTAIKNHLMDALEMEEKVTLIFYCFSLSLSFFLSFFLLSARQTIYLPTTWTVSPLYVSIILSNLP